jgi:UDP-3-O-[3-hydroxymyristoyl] glucosamine N-acyltransferase
MRVRELAEWLKASFEGDGERNLIGAAELERAGSAELSFVAAKKFWKAAESSAAGCLIVTPDFPSEGRTLIRVPEARGAFAHALHVLYPKPKPVPGVHPSAVLGDAVRLGEGVSIGPHASIGDGAILGDGVRIGPGAVIGQRVTIGRDSVLHARVTIYDQVTIGDRAVLHSGCVIGADGFGFAMVDGAYRKFPQVGTVRLGNDVEVGANACIDRAALGVTVIGDGVKLDNMVHIAHNCLIGDHVVIAAQTGLSGGVAVGDYAVIGGQVGIGDKARIESRAVLGSGCGVLTSKIVRAGQPVWGTPARPLKEYLAQLARVSHLPQMQHRLRELTAWAGLISERLGVPPPTPAEPDSTD